MGSSGGTRIVCVSGHVNKPGVFELPMGITFARAHLRRLRRRARKGRKLKARDPGRRARCRRSTPASSTSRSSSTRCRPTSASSTSRSSRACSSTSAAAAAAHDGRLGRRRRAWTTAPTSSRLLRAHHAVLRARVVRSVHAVPRGHRLAGEASASASRDGEGEPGDVDLLANIAHGIAGNTICALGDAAAWPMLGFLTKFRADFEAKIAQSPKARRAADPVPTRRRRRQRQAGGDRDEPACNAAAAGYSAPLGQQVLFYVLARLGGGLRAVRHHARATRSRAVMSLVATFFGLAAIYVIAVRALPGGDAGAGLRRRHHGAVRLRDHDPEPRGGARRWRCGRSRLLGVAAAAYLAGAWCRRHVVAIGAPTLDAPPVVAADVRHRRRRSASLLFTRLRCSRSRRSRCCCWSRSSAASSCSRSHRRRSPRSRAADYRQQVERSWPRADYPGARDERTPPECITAMLAAHYLVLVVVLFLIGDGRRADAPQRADRADEHRAACSTRRT